MGERCVNANLCSLIPLLEVKLGMPCLPPGKLCLLTPVSAYVSEVANLTPFSRQPFVGHSAFAHKGGVHVSAVNRDSGLYEHMKPELVGNGQRILITELGGRSNIVALARRFNLHLDKDEPVVKGLFGELKQKASLGYDYAAAEASVELLLLRKLARRGVREFFRLHRLRVLATKGGDGDPLAEATIMVEVEGVTEHTAATGKGPVNAIDNALRKALLPFYPRLRDMRLRDFKVRVLPGANAEDGGTASVVRVLIESGDSEDSWVTVGVHHDIIEASWQALADSVIYKLYRDEWRERAGSEN
jgi:2-isopropylmalate synthase